MAKVRVRVPVVVDVPDPLLELLRAAAPLVQTISEHAPALRALSASGRTFAKEANRIVKAERAKKRARLRR
jgi:hypothetical protein